MICGDVISLVRNGVLLLLLLLCWTDGVWQRVSAETEVGDASVLSLSLPISICIMQDVHVDATALRELLGTLQSRVVPAINGSLPTELKGTRFVIEYTVEKSCSCTDQATNLCIENSGSVREPAIQTPVLFVDNAKEGQKEGDHTARLAGKVLRHLKKSAIPLLSRRPHFCLLEEDMLEVLLVDLATGATKQTSSLSDVNFEAIAQTLRGWLGHSRVSVSAITRDLSDHTEILSSMVRARSSSLAESYDPTTGRYVVVQDDHLDIDAHEFLQGIGEAHSIIRGGVTSTRGSPTRQGRARKHRILVYMLHTEKPHDSFRDKSHVYVNAGKIALLAPHANSEFNVTTCLLVGLADSIAGVPTASMLNGARLRLSESAISERVVRNLFVYEVSMLLTTWSKLRHKHSSPDVRIEFGKEDELGAVWNKIAVSLSQSNWVGALRLVQGELKAKVRDLQHSQNLQAKLCCEKQLISSGVENRRKKSLFALVYATVFVLAVAGCAAVVLLARRSRSVKILFDRQHTD